VASGDLSPTVVTCPAGEVALSGGGSVGANGSIKESHRYRNGWSIVVVSLDGATVALTAAVVCLGNVPGAAVIEMMQTESLPAGAQGTFVNAVCPAGTMVVGGGWVSSGIALTELGPIFLNAGVTGWRGSWYNATSTDHQVSNTAECLSAAGAHLTSPPFYRQVGTIPAGAAVQLQASCPAPSFVSGGGFERDPNNPGHMLDFHAANSQSWSATVASTGAAVSVGILAECLSFS
jgi:hypothetical protein